MERRSLLVRKTALSHDRRVWSLWVGVAYLTIYRAVHLSYGAYTLLRSQCIVKYYLYFLDELRNSMIVDRNGCMRGRDRKGRGGLGQRANADAVW